MGEHRASWKGELFMRRKGNSIDRSYKKTTGIWDSQSSFSASPERIKLRRASSDVVRPLNRCAKLLDSDDAVAQKLEKTEGALESGQSSQRSSHKDKAHKKGFLKTLVNLLNKNGSEELKEKGDKKSKEKYAFFQGPDSPEALAEPPEPTSKKKDKDKGDKKAKEKCMSTPDPESLETFGDLPEPTSKKKDKDKGDKKSKEKGAFPQGSEPLQTEAEPTSRKKIKDKGDKKSKEKHIFPQDSEPSETFAEAAEPIIRKKDKKSSLKKVFSFKRHANEEAKKSSGLDGGSPEIRRPAKPTFLPLCIRYRPESLTTPDSDVYEGNKTLSKESRNYDFTEFSLQGGRPPPEEEQPLNRSSDSNDIIIQKIAALLREEGDRWDEEIKGNPRFSMALNNLSSTSFQTLTEALINQKENPKKPDKSRVERRYQFAIYLTNKFAGNANNAVHCIMGHRDHTIPHTFSHIPYNNEQYGTSSPFISPD